MRCLRSSAASECDANAMPEIAYWERGEWWLAGDAKPWQPDAVRAQRQAGVPAAADASCGTRPWHP